MDMFFFADSVAGPHKGDAGEGSGVEAAQAAPLHNFSMNSTIAQPAMSHSFRLVEPSMGEWELVRNCG